MLRSIQRGLRTQRKVYDVDSNLNTQHKWKNKKRERIKTSDVAFDRPNNVYSLILINLNCNELYQKHRNGGLSKKEEES